MEFKGKRLYEITKEAGFNKKETGTKDCVLGCPTFNVRKMMKTSKQDREDQQVGLKENQNV